MDFAQPLLLILLVPAMIALAWSHSQSHHPMPELRRWMLLAARTLAVILAIAALAGPAIERVSDRESVVFVLDRSQSQGEAGWTNANAAAMQLSASLDGATAVGVVSAADEPTVHRAPSAGVVDNEAISTATADAPVSDLAAAVRLAAGLFPPGTARRIVIVGDGLETRGDLRAAAREAAMAGVRIDTVGVAGEVRPDVRVVALRPSRTRLHEGAPLTLEAELESSLTGDGRLRLFQNGIEVDARKISLKAGEPTTVRFDRIVEQRNLYSFRAVVEGFTAIPNEVYSVTGLKLKQQSPLETTFNIELANGAAGYIPPPSQFRFGGYTTWPARTAGLETGAEPKIVETLLTMLEKTSGRKRRALPTEGGAYVQSLLAAKPLALWRMEEIEGFEASDATDHGNNGTFHGPVAFYLDGPQGDAFSQPHRNRAVQFASGYMKASLDDLPEQYSVSLWFWNGLPASVRAVTGTLFARGDSDKQESLRIGGTRDPQATGKLVFRVGNRSIAGRTTLANRQWHNVVLVRTKDKASVYLDGNPKAEVEIDLKASVTSGVVFIAGDRNTAERFEGKIDEVAVYSRALIPKEIATHFSAGGASVKVGARGADEPPRSPDDSLRVPHVPE